MDREPGFKFPAGPSLSELSPGLTQHLHSLSLPLFLSSLQVSQSELTFSFLFPAAAFSDSPSSSQEHRVSGIGKPVLHSSSDPPVNSRCPKPEQPTPSPSATLKRQVGLLPGDAVLVKPEGTLIQRVGSVALSAPHVGLTVDSLRRQIQLEVITLIDKTSQVCSILKYMPVRGID